MVESVHTLGIQAISGYRINPAYIRIIVYNLLYLLKLSL